MIEFNTIDNKELILDEVRKLKKYESLVINKYKTKNNSKKMLPRQRIEALLDTKTSFFELSTLAGLNVYEEDTPAAGLITGIGIISSVRCMIICNDYTVKGGAYFPITVKKHLRAQDIAKENKLPVVYIVDSGGAFLPKQADLFADRDHFGRIFYNQAQLSALGIPQIALVMGSCTAGGAYIPAMSDETIMVANQSTVFLAGPPLVKAAIGEDISAESLGGADLHCKISGLSDHYAEDEFSAIKLTRNIISNLSTKKSEEIVDNYDQSNIYEHISSDPKYNHNMRGIIDTICDKESFIEFKEKYGVTIICGYAKVQNKSVAFVASNGVLHSDATLKACHFIQICDQRKIPIIFLQNITGFMVGSKAESAGIAKHGAALVNVISTSTVPKITIITGGSYGAGNYAMCGRAFNPRFIWSWPNSKTAIMGGDQAAGVLSSLLAKKLPYEDKMRKDKIESLKENIKKKYESESSAYYNSARLIDDGIIDPKDTRKHLILALNLSCDESTVSKYGIMRT
jgi:3-methylcrotonyl-CoA carboxylase beta subunit